jgi:hypothetical protein
MMTLDNSICWVLFAPLPLTELERIAAREWKRDFPYAIDPPPWEAIAGRKEYAALICRSPGAEGSDRHFAEITSRLTNGETVYSVWLDPERQQIFEWKNGKQIESRDEDPFDLAESLGFQVARQPGIPGPSTSLAVVEGASVEDVRRALNQQADVTWLRFEPNDIGVLVRAKEGPLGTQAWDIAEALPDATVYYVNRWLDPEQFNVLVLRGSSEVGRFRSPPFEGDEEGLKDVKGARTPEAVARALRIPSSLFGFA